jgi:peptidase C13-like protein
MGVSARARPGVRVALLAACLAVASPAWAQETHLVVITGVSGDQEHSEKFHKWATTLIEAAARQDGVSKDNIIYLAEKTEVDPRLVKSRSTRENVERAFADLAARVQPKDEVFVVLFGHGSFDGKKATFNLPGPDLTAEEWAKLLDKLPSQRLAFVDTASASGAFLQPLAGPGRAIVTATKTGGERNETEFPQYFVEAFTVEAADRNRDGRVSVREAFEYARSKVTEAYQQKGLLMTEHAALEDGHEGNFADTLFLQPRRVSTTDPALRALLEQKQALEDEVAALKLRKPTMEAGEYDRALEKLLTELALKTRAIQQLEGKKP